ncbi:MAG: bifunctional diaminohydroxyphosphoribosylaminopyrimidine deaminase/5-amino-6-(5-phosphoribosylamino)uracil reductase RibD [Ferrimicrobium sp.]
MERSSAMRRAITIGSRATLRCAPNPWVGAVVLVDDEVVAEGATSAVGGPHAEVVALSQLSGLLGLKAELMVTLEPCAHHGRTPPCTEAIVRSGIRRVSIGVLDPDPRVSGRGVAALRAEGIEVVVGVEEEQVIDSLGPYLIQRVTGRPFVVAKVAMSLDAKVADYVGQSRWITGAKARAAGHRLRARSQVIAVGAGTMERDRPRLTARRGESLYRNQPERWVFSHHLIDDLDPGIHVTEETPDAFLDRHGSGGVVQVLVEGGPRLVSSFLKDGLVDELWVAIAPTLFGDPRACAAYEWHSGVDLGEVMRGRFLRSVRLGDDLGVTLVPQGGDERRRIVAEWVVAQRKELGTHVGG